MKSLGRRVVSANRMIKTNPTVPAGFAPGAVPSGNQPEFGEPEPPKTTEESLLKTKDAPPEERLQYRQPPHQELEQIHEGEPPKVRPTVTVSEGAAERAAAVSNHILLCVNLNVCANKYTFLISSAT